MKYLIEERKLLNTIGNYFIEPEEITPLRRVMVSLHLAKDTTTELGLILAKLAEYGVMVAGGAITSLFTDKYINDLDLYMEDPKFKPQIMALLEYYFKDEPYVSANCITYKRKSSRSRKMYNVQLITRFSGPPEVIFHNFDFTITNGAYSFRDGAFHFGSRFFTDLATRKLVYSGGSEFPICALFRTKKYQARGYTLPGSTVMHIGLSIVRLEIKTYAELKQQLLGIDTLFLQGLLAKEQYADHLPVNYGEFLVEALDYLLVNPEEEDAVS